MRKLIEKKHIKVSFCYQKAACCLLLFALFLLGFPSLSQTKKPASAEDLKQLSIEELMEIEVTSVSKTAEKLSKVASAIQVITQDDIQRSAATSVPEVLRLSPNLQVAQINSRHWIVSARGFNNVFSNKLLVMIDGRTVYSPLFAGVFWDAQQVMLEDIDRIEVISGPGASIWGANAVNGVVNIITKSAKDVQGLYVSQSFGTFLERKTEARYAGAISPVFTYKVYAGRQERDNTRLASGAENMDKWGISYGGFDADWTPSYRNNLRVQANLYDGKERLGATPSAIDGQNIMANWRHTFVDSSGLEVQAFANRTWRLDVPGTINDELLTYDLDFQHHFRLAPWNQVVWGAGYRYMNDHTVNTTPYVGLVPQRRKMDLFSGFIQDDVEIIRDRLKLSVGTKLQHNDFTGFELQPSARISVMPFGIDVFWTSVSRAVRTPARIDVDYRLPTYPVSPDVPNVAGGPNFGSETLWAFEAGYRIQPFPAMSLSLAGFYNKYDDLHSVQVLPGTQTYQIRNGAKGTSHGLEFTGNYVVSERWRLRWGYTYLKKKLKNKQGNNNPPLYLNNLGSDPNHTVMLQSILNLPFNLKADLVARFVDDLPANQFFNRISSYYTADLRIAWQPRRLMEVALAGQNLLEKQHQESLDGVPVQRGVYGRVTFRY